MWESFYWREKKRKKQRHKLLHPPLMVVERHWFSLSLSLSLSLSHSLSLSLALSEFHMEIYFIGQSVVEAGCTMYGGPKVQN